MEARFGRIILKHVDKALQDEPSRDALLSLLQISDPNLVDNDLSNTSKRDAALRGLKLLIHPDKHPGDNAAATKRFQDTQTFYDSCVRCLSKGKKHKRPPSPSSGDLPLQFHVQDKWPFLAKATAHPVVPTEKTMDSETLEKVMAFKCINFRGAIAHGKRTELAFDFQQCVESTAQSTNQVFQSRGGSKNIEHVSEIKEEIMTRGPVVSTSFQPAQHFFNASDHSHAFEASLSFKSHPVLIVGWKQTASGEMWLVRSFKGASDIPIAVGQFAMEEEVLAPASDFLTEPWQSETKAFDLAKLPDGWYSWTNIEYECDRLQDLFKALGCSCADALSQKKPFVIRESEKIARSRYAYLTDIEWVASSEEWKINATFCDDKWTNRTGRIYPFSVC